MIDQNKGASVSIARIMLWIYSLGTVFIFIYMIYNSLRSRSDILSNTLGAPESLSLDNYVRLFVNDGFQKYFFNSVIVLVLTLIVITLLSSMVAYGLGRYMFKGRNFVRIYFLVGLMFPVQLGIVPIFLLMRDFHLIDSFASVILILGTGISMPVFMLTDFFAKLPKDIYEAAVIDGAGEWTIFYKIMFPMAKPVVFSICIIMSVQIWNQFFVPLIFLQSEENKTLPLIVVKYTKNLISTMDLALAASVMSTVPILVIFILFSKRILDGVASGGVKG
ncbi:carbohydrate ABC transporter permease [Bacillus sp. sid0103]|uniref:carbohydrate ABC transporter permease n=1 Tax=Bacillus sp. sid0103 TaxID=2856337 RepID=UPI001C45B600|nr:carbohydrate ABC transporter permease [Bacillus sp. sid0103]MBV7504358.1 carbohydrate ABC transporter permease [Bacillus sp. sid0103]